MILVLPGRAQMSTDHPTSSSSSSGLFFFFFSFPFPLFLGPAHPLSCLIKFPARETRQTSKGLLSSWYLHRSCISLIGRCGSPITEIDCRFPEADSLISMRLHKQAECYASAQCTSHRIHPRIVTYVYLRQRDETHLVKVRVGIDHGRAKMISESIPKIA